MTFPLAVVLDVAVILALALAAVAALRRRSAELRHAVLTVAILLATLVPVLELLLPTLPVVMSSAAADVPAALNEQRQIATLEVAPAAMPPRPSFAWRPILFGVWGLGTLVSLAGLLTSLVRLRRVTRDCRPIASGPWRRTADAVARAYGLRRAVELLQSSDPALLVSSGVLAPRIILPAGAELWSEARRRIVLSHEFAHVRRFDGAIQLTAECLRALHWFNPLAALTCAHLRRESEFACDDAVLRGGVTATDYATHLLAIAKRVAGRPHAWASAPAIAHPSTLARRVAAMLSHTRERRPLGRRGRIATAIVAASIAIPLTAAGIAPPVPLSHVATVHGDVSLAPAADVKTTVVVPVEVPAIQPLRPVPSAVAPASAVTEGAFAAPPVVEAGRTQEPASVSGTLRDQSGAVLPGVQLTLVDTRDAQAARIVITDTTGRFVFRNVLPSEYQLVASLPGFASVANALPVAAGAEVQRTITMPLGTLMETISVTCSATGAVRDPASPAAGRTTRGVWERLSLMLVPTLSAQVPSGPPVRVGGNVQPPRKLAHVNPPCPPALLPAADTTVIMVGRIGVDGYMSGVAVVKGQTGDAELIELALAAVRQWTFTPALLNGQAVEVNITVTVIYRRV